MFPIRDHNPSGRLPFVTYTLIALNCLIFLSYVSGINDPYVFGPILDNYALIPAEISRGGAPQTALTSLFLHAGWMHLIGNMLFLWIFGDNMEDAFGHFGFLAFYLVSGVAADAAHVLANPDSPQPLVGASGAIAGVMGGYLLLFPRAKVDVLFIFIIFFKVFSFSAWIVLIIWLGIQIFHGVGSGPAGGGVAYWAHAGGFVAGMALALPYWLRRGGPGFWAETEGHPPHPEQDIPARISNIPVVRRRK